MKQRFLVICRCLAVFAFGLVAILAIATGNVWADNQPAAVTGIVQTGSSETGIGISWNAVDCTGYILEHSTDKVEWIEEEAVQDTTGLVELEAGKSVYVRVRAFNAESVDSTSKEFGAYSEVIEAVAAPDASLKSKLTQTACTAKTASFKWNAIEGATSYRMSIMTQNGTEIKSMDVNSTKATVKGFNNTKYNYIIKIFAQRVSETGYRAVTETECASCNVVLTPAKLKGLKVGDLYHTSKKALITWNKSKNCSGVELELYNYQGKKIGTYKATKDNRVTLGKIKYDSFYKLRARAYVLLGKKKVYGQWSDYIYFTNGVDASITSRGGSINISWDPVDGADTYDVYISDKSGSGYKKAIADSKYTSQRINKFGKKSLKKHRKYYVKIVSKGKDKKKKISQAVVYYIKVS